MGFTSQQIRLVASVAAAMACCIVAPHSAQATVPSWVAKDFPGSAVATISQEALVHSASTEQSTSRGVYVVSVGTNLKVVASGSGNRRVYTIINSGRVDSSLVREWTSNGFKEQALGKAQSEVLLKSQGVKINRYVNLKSSGPTAHAACFPACVLIPLVWGALGAAFEYVVLGERDWETIAQHFAIDVVGVGVLGATARIASGLYKVALATRVGGAVLSPAERIRSAKTIVDLADKYNRYKTLAINRVVEEPATHTAKKVTEICTKGTAVFSGFFCAKFQKQFTEEALRKFGGEAIDEIAKFSTAEFANWAWAKITGNGCRGWWEGKGLTRLAADYGRMALNSFCTGIIPAGVFTGPAWAKDVEPARRMSITADPHLKELMSQLLPAFVKDMREDGRPVSITLYAGGGIDTPVDDASHGRVSLGVSWRSFISKDPGGIVWYRGAYPRYKPQCSKPPICTGQMWVVTRGDTAQGVNGDFIDWLKTSQEASNILYQNDFYSMYRGAGPYTVNHYLKFTVDSHLYPTFSALASRYVAQRKSMGSPVVFKAWKTENSNTPVDDAAHGRVDFGIMWRGILSRDPGGVAWYKAANWTLPLLCNPHCVNQFWFTSRSDSIMPAGLEFINWIRNSPVARSILSPKWSQVDGTIPTA